MRYKQKNTSDEAWLEFCVDKTLEEISEHFKVAKTSARTRCSTLGIKLRAEKNRKDILELKSMQKLIQLKNVHYFITLIMVRLCNT